MVAATDVDATSDLSGIRVLLFDVGGVLVELSGMDRMLEWPGHRWRPDQLWQKWLTSPAVRAFETGQLGADAFATALVPELGLAVSPAEFLRQYTTWLRGLYPGVVESLDGLRDRYVLASLSNTNELHWPRIYRDMGLDRLLTHHFPSHQTGRIKPDRSAFVQVMSALDVPAAAICFFDDNQLNVDAAAAVGIRAYRTRGAPELLRVLRAL